MLVKHKSKALVNLVVGTLLLLFPVLVSCDQEEGCFSFQFEIYTEIYREDTLFERRQECVYEENICGISYQEAKTYAMVSSHPVKITNYLVIGFDTGNIEVYQVREVKLIEK